MLKSPFSKIGIVDMTITVAPPELQRWGWYAVSMLSR